MTRFKHCKVCSTLLAAFAVCFALFGLQLYLCNNTAQNFEKVIAHSESLPKQQAEMVNAYRNEVSHFPNSMFYVMLGKPTKGFFLHYDHYSYRIPPSKRG